MLKKSLLPLCIFVFFTGLSCSAQFSLSVKGGVGKPTDNGPDPWNIDSPWPATAAQTTRSASPFCTRSSITTLSTALTWEATQIFGLSLIYQHANFVSTENHRKTNSHSFGVQTRFNFVRNTRKFVPFIQTSFFFLNSLNFHQDQVTSLIQGGQTQPGFDIPAVTNVGMMLELGAEVKLARSLSLLVSGGLNGMSITSGTSDAALVSQSYGPYIGPRGFEGVVWMQGSLSLKYYFNKSTKTRNF